MAHEFEPGTEFNKISFISLKPGENRPVKSVQELLITKFGLKNVTYDEHSALYSPFILCEEHWHPFDLSRHVLNPATAYMAWVAFNDDNVTSKYVAKLCKCNGSSDSSSDPEPEPNADINDLLDDEDQPKPDFIKPSNKTRFIDQTVLEGPIYKAYIYDTATVAFGLLMVCCICGDMKSLISITRRHILPKRDWRIAYAVRNCYPLLKQTENETVTLNRDHWDPQKYVIRNSEHITFMNKEFVTLESDERYVSNVLVPMMVTENKQDGNNVALIQSPMGTGKSAGTAAVITQLYERNRLPNGVCVPVMTRAQVDAHERSFNQPYPQWEIGRALPSDMNVKNYQTCDETVATAIVKRKRKREALVFSEVSIIVTINSIVQHLMYTFEGETRIHLPSLVWLDEAVSILAALLCSAHLSEAFMGRAAIIKVVEFIVSNCEYLIVTDAFLDTGVYQWITKLRAKPECHPGIIDRIANVEMTARTVVNSLYIHANSITEFLHDVASELGQGKRLYIPMDSKSQAKFLYDGIVQYMRDKGISEEEIKIKIYSADTNDYEKSRDFRECHIRWTDLNCVIVTPTLQTGVSFDPPDGHFHKCLLHTTGKSVCAGIIMQMIARIRLYIDAEIHAYMPVRNGTHFSSVYQNAILTDYEVNRQLTSAICCRKLLTLLSPSLPEFPVVMDPIDGLVPDGRVVESPSCKLSIQYNVRDAKSKLDLATELVRYAKFAGWNVQFCLPSTPISVSASIIEEAALEEMDDETFAAEIVAENAFMHTDFIKLHRDVVRETPEPVFDETAVPIAANGEIAKADYHAYLVTIDPTQEIHKGIKGMPLHHQAKEQNKLLQLRTMLGLRWDAPLTKELIAEAYDKPLLKHKVDRLKSICLDHERSGEANDIESTREVEFYRSTHYDPIYGYIAIHLLVEYMKDANMFEDDSNLRSIFCDKFKFSSGRGGALTTELCNRVEYSLTTISTQLGRTADQFRSKSTYMNLSTQKTLRNVYEAAMGQMGFKLKKGERKSIGGYLTTTNIVKPPTIEAEIFIVSILNALRHNPSYCEDQSLSLVTITDLIKFMQNHPDMPTMRHTEVHGYTWDSINVDVLLAGINTAPIAIDPILPLVPIYDDLDPDFLANALDADLADEIERLLEQDQNGNGGGLQDPPIDLSFLEE